MAEHADAPPPPPLAAAPPVEPPPAAPLQAAIAAPPQTPAPDAAAAPAAAALRNETAGDHAADAAIAADAAPPAADDALSKHKRAAKEAERQLAMRGPPIGPLDPHPVASPSIPVSVGPIGAKDTAPPPTPTAAAQDAPLATGDEAVRQAQVYLRQLGFFHGEPDGIMDWPTVEALVKFDASGTGPNTVIADASRPDSVWLARLRTAAAAVAKAVKDAPPPASP